MLNKSWVAIMKYFVLTLLVLAALVPLYTFPTLDEGRGGSTYIWTVVQNDPLMGLAFIAPLFVFTMLGRQVRRPWNRVVVAVVPLVLFVSVFVVYLGSALALSTEKNPLPFFSFPPLWVSSSIGLGCWAFLAANALLLGCWVYAARKKTTKVRGGAI